jgi:hypothetical protein
VAGFIVFLVFVNFFDAHAGAPKTDIEPGWPSVTQQTKPWSRWWWMGSAVDPTNLKAAMEAYSKAGLGGLEITPIYGVHGYESKFVKFLSPEWMKNFEYTLQEGKQLNMGIDMAMASGWPFGGLWVTPEDACKYMSIQSYRLTEGQQLPEKITMVQEPILQSISRKNLNFSELEYPVSANEDSLQNWALEQVRYPRPMIFQALMAYSDKGEILNLTDKVDALGRLLWKAPAGTWLLYAVFEGWHGKMVERAAPGGEGDVIDHFSNQAIDNYLGHFDTVLKGQNLDGLRAYFNDSYEVDDARGEADYTPRLFDEFQDRRGYDLREYLPALLGRDEPGYNERVLTDYRETISDLILEKYTQRWHDWAARKGKIIRNQAHGAPANILDLYAAADIPETEGEDIIKIKFASSAAHVSGKLLASSESATWLKDHFEASLADVRQAIDRFLLGGVNHVFYHGTTFSPQNAPWPGWLFYAAVNFAPSNTFWNDFGALNAYITRSQSFLQAGKPDNDILLYYPISDEYAIRGKALLEHFDGSDKGFPMRETAENLFNKGYAFDYISDHQILKLENNSDQVLSGGNRYKLILLPKVKLMPIETLEKLIDLAKGGATVLMEKLPEDVPGLGNLEARQARFKALLGDLKFKPTSEIVQRAKVGKGEILLGGLTDLLNASKVRRESMFDRGLQCIRRTNGNTTVYFIANRDSAVVNGWVPLESKMESAVLYNPMTGAYGQAKVQKSGNSGEVYLQLNPGESCLVQLFHEKTDTQDYRYLQSSGEKTTIGGNWTLTFVSGGPELPKPVKLDKLGSWTEIQGGSYKAFSGTAVYKTTFKKPSGENGFYRIDLGKVDCSARVTLNGKELATLISPPFVVDIPDSELKSENTLEVAVSNLMGNRIADMERKGEKYKIFYNVNFPAKEAANRGADGLFSAKNRKPQESGLIGPVTVTPMEKMK